MKKLISKKEIFKVKSVSYDLSLWLSPVIATNFNSTAHYTRKQYRDAAKDLEQAARLDINNIDAYNVLGIVYEVRQRNENAV